MLIERNIAYNRARLTLSGRFDFHAHRDFRQSCDEVLANREVNELDIDLAGVDYLDSSALGMLLLLREKATAQGVRIVLSGIKGNVKQVLEVANFSKLFTLRDEP